MQLSQFRNIGPFLLAKIALAELACESPIAVGLATDRGRRVDVVFIGRLAKSGLVLAG